MIKINVRNKRGDIMKKINLRYIVLSVIAVTALSLQSCSNNDSYDVVGNPNNLFYIKANSSSSVSSPNTLAYTVTHTPVGDFGEFSAKFPVRCLRPSSGNAIVKAEIDTSLISTYNTKYGTSYKPFPNGVFDKSNMNVTVLKDSCKGQDSITVSISNANLAKLTDSSYIAPIRIYSVEGTDGKASNDYGIAYVVVTTQTKLINNNVDPSNMLGSLVTDFSNWTAEYPDGTSLNISDVTGDNLSGDGWSLTTNNNTVIVDMKSVKNVTGIRSCRWYYYNSDWDWGYGYTFSSITFYLSQDGNTWTDAGTANQSDMSTDQSYYQYLSLYGAVKARYLKMQYSSGSSSVSSLTGLGVYVQ